MIDQDELQKIKDEIDREVNEAADLALASPQPAAGNGDEFTFTRPTSIPRRKILTPKTGAELSGNAGTMVDLINRCLHTEMARDPRIVVFGEDVADCLARTNISKK